MPASQSRNRFSAIRLHPSSNEPCHITAYRLDRETKVTCHVCTERYRVFHQQAASQWRSGIDRARLCRLTAADLNPKIQTPLPMTKCEVDYTMRHTARTKCTRSLCPLSPTDLFSGLHMFAGVCCARLVNKRKRKRLGDLVIVGRHHGMTVRRYTAPACFASDHDN